MFQAVLSKSDCSVPLLQPDLRAASDSLDMYLGRRGSPLFELRASDLEARVLAVASRWHDLDLQLHRTTARQFPRQREGELLRLGGIARAEFGIGEQTEAADLLFLALFLLHRHDTLHGAVARRLVAQNADDHALLSGPAL